MAKIKSTDEPAARTQTEMRMNSRGNDFDDNTSLLHYHDTVSTGQELTHVQHACISYSVVYVTLKGLFYAFPFIKKPEEPLKVELLRNYLEKKVSKKE